MQLDRFRKPTRSLLSKSFVGVSDGVYVGRDLAVRWAVVCGAGWLRCGGVNRPGFVGGS